jgi:hypothetical protein
MTTLRNVHLALQEFAAKNHIALDPLASVGHITLTVENTYRIHITPIQGGALVLTGRLCALPEEPVEQESVIDKVLDLAYINARDTEVYPALEPDQESIALQMLVAPHIKLWSFEKKLEQFTNQFSIWRDYLNKKN